MGALGEPHLRGASQSLPPPRARSARRKVFTALFARCGEREHVLGGGGAPAGGREAAEAAPVGAPLPQYFERCCLYVAPKYGVAVPL